MMWSDAVAATCTTTSGGTCTVTRSNIVSTVNALTLDVKSVTLSGSLYDPAHNDVTSITVNKPL